MKKLLSEVRRAHRKGEPYPEFANKDLVDFCKKHKDADSLLKMIALIEERELFGKMSWGEGLSANFIYGVFSVLSREIYSGDGRVKMVFTVPNEKVRIDKQKEGSNGRSEAKGTDFGLATAA